MHAQNVAIIKFLSLSRSRSLFPSLSLSVPPLESPSLLSLRSLSISCPLSAPGFARKSDGNYRGFKGSAASGLGGQFRGNPWRAEHLRKGASRQIDTRNSPRNWDLKEEAGEAGEWRNDRNPRAPATTQTRRRSCRNS